ncbi:hypothetical protein [Streptomyces hydrogenans]
MTKPLGEGREDQSEAVLPLLVRPGSGVDTGVVSDVGRRLSPGVT